MAKSGPAPQIVTSYHFTPAPFPGTLITLLREPPLMFPAARRHRVYDLIETYEREYGAFPHDKITGQATGTR